MDDMPQPYGSNIKSLCSEKVKIQHKSNKPFQPSERFLTFFLNGFRAVCSGKHWVLLQSAPYSVLTIDIKITLICIR